ncbi:MAG: DNA-formamidopyrimidine glycosylase family protein [Candidatus Odinarchaeota archaeon]
MSIELPEALILAGQMNEILVEKQIASCTLQDCERLQRTGFLNKNITDFDRLVKGRIQAVTSRGMVILLKLDTTMNLLLAPEYGGKLRYHIGKSTTPGKIHLEVNFTDNTALTVRLTGMGAIFAADNKELERIYFYKRDFSGIPSPVEDDFTFDRFLELTRELKRNLKSVLVGKDAILVGLSNSAFQDIIYRAELHPKRKISELDSKEFRALFDAINTVIKERIRLKGKHQFTDLHGKQGGYVPAMGPNMKGQGCPACGTGIEKLNVGGGDVFYCPTCQK